MYPFQRAGSCDFLLHVAHKVQAAQLLVKITLANAWEYLNVDGFLEIIGPSFHMFTQFISMDYFCLCNQNSQEIQAKVQITKSFMLENFKLSRDC